MSTKFSRFSRAPLAPCLILLAFCFAAPLQGQNNAPNLSSNSTSPPPFRLSFGVETGNEPAMLSLGLMAAIGEPFPIALHFSR